MTRTATLRAIGLILASCATCLARDGGPVLVAPAEVPPVVESSDSEARPPVGRPAPLPPFETAGDSPALLPPADMQAPAAGRRPAPRPLTLESTPIDGLDARKLDAERPMRSDKAPTGPKSILRQRKPGRSVLPMLSRGRGRGEDEDAVVIEPKSDPAADAALKRRLERQIRDTLGDRVRSLEVLVVDRRVVIQARSSRFWQRRAVRKSIEGLPDLVGYRATIHVDE